MQEGSQELQGQKDIEDQFLFIKNLGKGTFGRVVLAQDRESGKYVALKFVRKDRTPLAAFLQEVRISLYLAKHPGIITTYPNFKEVVDHYVFAQELAAAGTLHSLIKAEAGISEDMVKSCAVQIIRALNYMHGKGLVHRDLKPDNVLLMDKQCHHIKLCDFGHAKRVGSPVSRVSHIIPYMAPEYCELASHQVLILDTSIDVWALGVLLFVALTGYFPWKGAVEHDQRYQTFANWQSSENPGTPPDLWFTLTTEALDMFCKLLSCDPSVRDSADIVLDYIQLPWNAYDNSEEDEDEEDTDEDMVEEEDTDEEDGEEEYAEEEENVELEEDVIKEEESQELKLTRIAGQEDVCLVNNAGDMKFVYVDNTGPDSSSHTNNPVIMLLMEDLSLSMAYEVEIT